MLKLALLFCSLHIKGLVKGCSVADLSSLISIWIHADSDPGGERNEDPNPDPCSSKVLKEYQLPPKKYGNCCFL